MNMAYKKLILVYFLLLLLSPSGVVAIDHSTYVIGGNIKSAGFVDGVNFASFDYMYVMAAPNWKDVDFTACQESIDSVLVDGFHYPSENGVELVPYFIEAAHKNGTKVLLSFAGEGFRKKVEDLGQRKKFISFMVSFIQKYGYDGIEIDWESDLDLRLHADFIADIRKKLDELQDKESKRKYLTTALHSWQVYNKDLASRLEENIDWINIMTYDMGGGIWGYKATHNTPLNQMAKELKNWNVFDRKKLNIGFANYGFIYEGIQPGQEVKEKLNNYGRYISYNEFLPLLSKGWVAEYDEPAQVNYYYSPDRKQFVTMENKETIAIKNKWVKEEGYRGIFWWEFSYDMIVPAKKGDKIEHHLIDVIRK